MSAGLPAPGRPVGPAAPGQPIASKSVPELGREALDKGLGGVKRLFGDVDWSLSYLAFLTYFVVIMTYRFGGASTAVAVAAGGLIIERGKRRFPPWIIWSMGFVLWGAVSFTQSAYPSVAWTEGFIEYGKLWLICLVGANVLTSGPRLRFFLVFFLVLYMSHPIRGELFNTFIYGSAELGRSSWNGLWRNPNDMAALTFLPLGIAAGLLKDRSDWVRKGALISVALMALGILLTRSRGGFLALGVFGMLTIFANRRQLKGLVGVGVIAGIVVLLAPAGTFERFGNFSSAVRGGDLSTAEDSQSAEQRLEIWEIAGGIIRENPVFGVGLAAYPNAHGQAAYLSAQLDLGGGRRDTHSTYIRVTAETGYPGAVLYFLPFIIIVARSRRIRRKFGEVHPEKAEVIKYVEAGLIAYLITCIFGSYAHTVFLWLHLGLLSLVTEDLRQAALQAARPVRGPHPPVLARRPLPRAVGAPG